MNHLLLVALLILVATNSYAQSPIEGATKDGRAVILKPDGTWEFKKAVPAASATPAVPSEKSIVPAGTLPPSFPGDHFLWSRMIDFKQRLVKSEFETTSQYQKRRSEELHKPIAENLTINDTFAIVVSGVQADYDADSGKMQLYLPVRKSDSVRYHAYTKETTDDLSWVNLYQIQFDPSAPLSASAGLFFDDTGNLVLSGAGSPGSDVFSPTESGC